MTLLALLTLWAGTIWRLTRYHHFCIQSELAESTEPLLSQPISTLLKNGTSSQPIIPQKHCVTFFQLPEMKYINWNGQVWGTKNGRFLSEANQKEIYIFYIFFIGCFGFSAIFYFEVPYLTRFSVRPSVPSFPSVFEICVSGIEIYNIRDQSGS